MGGGQEFNPETRLIDRMLEAERVRREKFGSEGGEVPLRFVWPGALRFLYNGRAPRRSTLDWIFAWKGIGESGPNFRFITLSLPLQTQNTLFAARCNGLFMPLPAA